AEAWPDLVAELGLNLVEIHRQLPVAADVLACDVGDDFLMRRAEAEVALVTILDPEHLWAEFVPTPAFLPQLGRLHRRHDQLDRAAAIHLFAHDALDLTQYSQYERHPGVQSAAELPDQAGAQHELVADELSLGGGFFQRR